MVDNGKALAISAGKGGALLTSLTSCPPPPPVTLTSYHMLGQSAKQGWA
jgi:hypothetical protein